jgi:uncharacterized membrane protein
MKTSKTIETRQLVILGLLTTIVFVFQLLGAFVRFSPTHSVSLVLLPIVIGAAMIGKYAGAWLGLVFGFVVLISGDAALFLSINPAATVFVVLLKGTLAGFAAGALYKPLARISKTIAAVAAAVVCPVVNTAVFIVGCYAFFLPTLRELGIAAEAANVTAFIFVFLIGLNFFFELGLNLILSPVIIRLLQYREKRALS